MSEEIYEKIQQAINSARNILLIAHRKPDGDTLGAIGAFLVYLEKADKKAEAFCVDRAPLNLNFLPRLEKIFNEKEKLDYKQYDCIITLDCSDWQQAVLSDDLTSQKEKIINIDHHRTNTNYGRLNLVAPEASSTCEVVYDFFNQANIEIDAKIATCLLTGIVTDTNNFFNPATSFSAMTAASRLLKKGARFQKIVDNFFKSKTLNSLKLWGKALSDLYINKKRGVLISVITHEDYEKYNITEEMVEGLANFLQNLHEARVVLVLKEEEKGEIRGSLRTMSDKIDVAKLAQRLGGGGHQKAAGFRVSGKLVKRENGWSVV